ncbi:MAG: 50S ribosomal protein L10 [Thermodesulfobacteriota bacterium]
MNRSEKQVVVDAMAERLGRAKACVLTNFTGLKVEQMTDLRQKLRENRLEYVVVKNTLLKRAGEGSSAALLADELTGPNGLAIAYDDPVALAKILVDFAKINPKLELRSGVLEGKLISAAQVADLAKMPSREQLLAMLLGAMNGVPRNLVSVLAAVPRSLLNALNAIKDQKAEAA